MSGITLSRKQAVLALGGVVASLSVDELRKKLGKERLLQAIQLTNFALAELERQGLEKEGTIGNMLELGEHLVQSLKEQEPAE